MKQAKVLIESNNILGEGPLWDSTRNELLWVDIEQQLLCFYNPNTKLQENFKMPTRIGTAAPVPESKLYMVALQNGLHHFDRENNSFQLISDPEKHLPDNRFNDGKYDASGRFWVGSMHLEAKASAGNLYMLSTDHRIHHKLKHLSISNGMAWTEDQRYMYFIDTASYAVSRYDFDNETGDINNEKKVISVPPSHGAPDGMCIDNAGMLWIAHWGGNKVSQWNPITGKLIKNIEVAAPHVTSCCIGGNNSDTLFITTASTGLTDVQLKQFPLSGSVFYHRI